MGFLFFMPSQRLFLLLPFAPFGCRPSLCRACERPEGRTGRMRLRSWEYKSLAPHYKRLCRRPLNIPQRLRSAPQALTSRYIPRLLLPPAGRCTFCGPQAVCPLGQSFILLIQKEDAVAVNVSLHRVNSRADFSMAARISSVFGMSFEML